MESKDLKLIVKEKYGRIVTEEDAAAKGGCCGTGSSCCGPSISGISDIPVSFIGDDYKDVKGYNAQADYGLGCGIPTRYVDINPGDRVLDLGSGAGNDCFVARALTGPEGSVTGIDFTPQMIEKAKENCDKMGYSNVSFILGDIEEMPFDDNSFDVVISNCVLNLVPDKTRAFKEIMRVLKPGGHFCVSDVVIKGVLPHALRSDAEMYAGCVSGALEMQRYLDIVTSTGFKDLCIHKQNKIEIPAEVYRKSLTDVEIDEFMKAGNGILSITVSAVKNL